MNNNNFYTNSRDLRTCLPTVIRNNSEVIDWQSAGMDTREVSSNSVQGILNDEPVSVLPISDIDQFNLTIGHLIGTTNEYGEFFEIVTDEEKASIAQQIQDQIPPDTNIEAEINTMMTGGVA